MIERRAFNSGLGKLFFLRQDLSKTDIDAQLLTFFYTCKGAHGEPTLLLLTLQNSARKLPLPVLQRARVEMLKIVIMRKIMQAK